LITTAKRSATPWLGAAPNQSIVLSSEVLFA
jgi:hypothetical protein